MNEEKNHSEIQIRIAPPIKCILDIKNPTLN